MKVLVTTCTGDAWNHKRVTFALIRLALDLRHQVHIEMPTHRPYEHALNRVAKDLKEKYVDHDYWLNIDDDNPPTRNPLDLVDLNKDYIGFPTPVWHDAVKGDQPYYYNILNEDGDGYKPASGEGLFQVDATGSGCFLVHRRVIESVTRPWFMREYDEDGLVVRGHDYLFCDKLKRAGFEVWTHTGYPCEHYVETDLHSQIAAFREMR